MRRHRVTGFELRLLVDWYPVEREDPDGTWPRTLADHLVQASAEPGENPAVLADRADVLAEQLAEVLSVARATGIPDAEGIVRVADPRSGVVEALVVLATHPDLDAATFTGELRQAVAEAAPDTYSYVGEVLGDVDAGEVVGLHLVGAAHDPAPDEVAQLEERVVVGVFPPRAVGMVEVTAIARGVGVLELPQEVVDVLAGLTIESVRS